MRTAQKGTPLGLTRLERQVLLAMYRRIRRRILDGLSPDLAVHNAFLGLLQLQGDLLLADDQDRNVGELSRVRKRLLGTPIATAPERELGPFKLRGANVYDFEVIAETCGAFGRELIRRLKHLGQSAAGLLITGRCLNRARRAYNAGLRRCSEPGYKVVGRLAWCLAGLGVPDIVAKTILEAFAREAQPQDGPIRRSTLGRAWGTARGKQQAARVNATMADWERQLQRIFGIGLSSRELERVRATEEAKLLEAQSPAFVLTDPSAVKAIGDLRRLRQQTLADRIEATVARFRF